MRMRWCMCCTGRIDGWGRSKGGHLYQAETVFTRNTKTTMTWITENLHRHLPEQFSSTHQLTSLQRGLKLRNRILCHSSPSHNKLPNPDSYMSLVHPVTLTERWRKWNVLFVSISANSSSLQQMARISIKAVKTLDSLTLNCPVNRLQILTLPVLVKVNIIVHQRDSKRPYCFPYVVSTHDKLKGLAKY